MTDTATHTPTPWKPGKHGELRAPDGRQVATYGLNIAAIMSSPTDEDRANTAFIIHAVNSFDELISALQICQSALAMMVSPESIRQTPLLDAFATAINAEYKARTAIAKAEGLQDD